MIKIIVWLNICIGVVGIGILYFNLDFIFMFMYKWIINELFLLSSVICLYMNFNLRYIIVRDLICDFYGY